MNQQLDMFDPFTVAQHKMEHRFSLGEAQQRALLNSVMNTVIIDKLVPPKAMRFIADPTDKNAVRLAYGDDVPLRVHRHALNQLCKHERIKFPMAYLDRLAEGGPWSRELLAHNLNELYHQPNWAERSGQPPRFLHRIVGNELRGFLSRRFNRHMASAPLLSSFIDACQAAGAQPVEATSSAVRSALKCFIPLVFEAFPGEYICIGVEWSNSDFGSGRLQVLQSVWRIGAGTSSVLDPDSIRGRHIGSIIEDQDLEISNETAQKEVAAQQSAVRDYVGQYLAESNIERLLTAIRAARDEQIPWSQLRARIRSAVGDTDAKWLQSVLDQKEDTVIDLPPVSFAPDGSRMPNLYWAAGALGHLAKQAEDPDRRLDLQREAGKLLMEALEKA
jgi:hypothetical protein